MIIAESLDKTRFNQFTFFWEVQRYNIDSGEVRMVDGVMVTWL